MRIIICKDYNEVSEKAAQIVASQVTLKPNSVLSFIAGSTPKGMYNRLSEMNLDFSEAVAFSLDEYYPIKKTNTQSYYHFMNEHLYSKVNFKAENIYIPNGETDDVEAECAAYDKAIKENNGVDLQILGIGKNGHIGFNVPGTTLNSTTHLTDLREIKIEHISKYFKDKAEVPKQGITMGISTILSAKKIVLLASGSEKSYAISQLLNSQISTNFPATMLKVHPDVVLICDEAAYYGSKTKLGIDIGGTDIKFAVVRDGKVIQKNICKCPKESGDKVVEAIKAQCDKIRETHSIGTVGVGTPGINDNGKISAVNLPFDNYPLKSKLSEALNLPVEVNNDANCAALGEVLFGGKNYNNIVMITLGTGVGGGIIIDKQICQGGKNAGEIGHIVIQTVDGKACPCGQNGCFEQYASVTALIKNATDAAFENKDSLLYSLYEKNGSLNGKSIFEALDGGCAVAKKVFEEYIVWLSVGIKTLINIFDPDAIVLSGGITARGDEIIKELRKHIGDEHIIEISKLQNDAGALGASALQ